MDFFGIGAMELLLILLLALIVVGPRQLPEVARRLAQLLRTARGMWTEVSASVTQQLDAEGALSELRDLTDTVGSLRRPPSPADIVGEFIPQDVVRTLESRPPSPAQLLGDVMPQDAVKTLETRPPSPAQILAPAIPTMRGQVPPSAASLQPARQATPHDTAAADSAPVEAEEGEGAVVASPEGGESTPAPAEPSTTDAAAEAADARERQTTSDSESSSGA